MPPMSQKNARLEASWTRCDASANSEVEHPPAGQEISGLSTCIRANPPPPNGSITFWAGNASTPNAMRRTSLNWTSRKPEPTEDEDELGSKITACALARKIACSYATYSAVRRAVISQCPPTIGSYTYGCTFVLEMNPPPCAPQYH